MSILVDTSVLVAFLNVKDPDHARAMGLMVEILSRRHGEPFGTDKVLGEGLTLLQRRAAAKAVLSAYTDLFWGSDKAPPRLRLLFTEETLLRAATRLYFEHHRRKLSFTDCTLLAHAEATGARIATFDRALLAIAKGIGAAGA